MGRDRCHKITKSKNILLSLFDTILNLIFEKDDKFTKIYTVILYRASAGSEQGFPCVVFPHRETPVFITGMGLQCVYRFITQTD